MCLQWTLLVSGELKTNDNMLMWFYQLACHMEKLSTRCINMIDNNTTTKIKSRQCIDQFLELKHTIQNHCNKCNQVRSYIDEKENHVDCIYLFNPEEGDAIFSKFFSSWVLNMYYVWIYCKTTGFLNKFLNNNVFICLGDIAQWEIICSDEDVELLAHPSLPHPFDFLTRKKIVGDRYADKARFEYCFQWNWQKYNVVLSKTPSVIPKLKMPVCVKETSHSVLDHKKQCLFQESTRTHKMGVKKKQKTVSHILKETRKKNKKNWNVGKRLEMMDDDDDDFCSDFVHYSKFYYDYY